MLNNKKNFLDIIHNNIVIPIIQRDYIQGKNSFHTRNTMDNFFKDLENHFQNTTNQEMDLNFIYGKKIHNNEFIPLDGQQRLTLLFLLYLYIGFDTNKLKNFTYKTRESSTDFIDKLIDNFKNIKQEKGDNLLSLTIKNQTWFRFDWEYDPTIQSILVILDKIHEKLGSILNLDKLNNIKFTFLDIEKIDNDEDIYIKLNARGKQLTNFENFKADIFNSNIYKDLEEIFRDKFQINIDNKWLDFFWSKETFDSDILSFFHSIFLNYSILNGKKYENNKFSENEIKKKENFLFSEYSVEPENIKSLYYALNFICDKDKDKKFYSEYYNFNNISCSDNDKKDYSTQLMLFAIISYFDENKETNEEDENFRDYLRICRNLTQNTIINKLDEFIDRQNFIYIFSKENDIIKYFANLVLRIKNGFEEYLIKEETLKARLIKENICWKKEIEKAENNIPCQSGQIQFLLNFSSEFSYNIDKCNFEKFIEYFEKTNILLNYIKEPENNLKLISYFLLDYDCLIKVESKHYYIPKLENGANRTDDRTWKNILKNEEKQKHFKDLLDKIDLKSLNIDEIIDLRVNEYLKQNPTKENEWQYYIVKYIKNIFEDFTNIYEAYPLSHFNFLTKKKKGSGSNISFNLYIINEEIQKIKNIEINKKEINAIGIAVGNKLFLEITKNNNKEIIIHDIINKGLQINNEEKIYSILEVVKLLEL